MRFVNTRLSTTLFVLCSALTLPACLAAGGSSSESASESASVSPLVGSERGYDFGPSISDCGCVFPSQDPEVSVATTCGEAVCFEEQTYFCTYEGVAVTIGTCVGASDGEFDLTGYEFPADNAQPSSCQGDAGTCSGDDAGSCEAKAGCTFMPNGECFGTPVPCPSRNQEACTTFGGGCFHVSPFED